VRPHGRASVSTRNPRAFGICDRCGFLYNHNRLQWQFDYAGAGLINKRILVCNPCNDVPQAQLRAIVLPADPVPIMNPRVQDYVTAETNYRLTQGNTVDPITGLPIPGGQTRITQDNNTRVTQMTGESPNGLNQLPGTDPNAVTYRNVVSATDNGSGLIRLNIVTTNGMITGQLVTIQEVSGVPANGNWTITVVDSANIDLNNSTFSGVYVSGGYVINNPSLPYSFSVIPRTGPLT
jgi:hypothetical protein